MNRTVRNTEHRQNNSNKINYAQAAGSVSGSQHQPTRSHHYSQYNAQPEMGNAEQQAPYYKNYRPNNNMTHSSYHTHRHNNYHHNNKFRDNRDNNGYNNRKGPVQLPVQPSIENSPIHFGSVNQSNNTQAQPTSPTGSTGESIKQADINNHHNDSNGNNGNNYRPHLKQDTTSQQRQDMLPRAHRNNGENKLFAASYAPRRDYHHNNTNYNYTQMEQPYYTNYNASNNHSNNSHRYFNNYHNNSESNGNNTHSAYRPPQPSSGNHNQQPYVPQQPAPQHSSVQYSPQSANQSPQQQNTSTAPINPRTASPNMNTYNSSKKSSPAHNYSPHNAQATPPPNMSMTGNWPPAGQYYFPGPAPYTMTVPYMVPPPTARPPILAVPPPTRKAITIINPETGNVVDTSASYVARRRNSNSSTTSTSSTKPSPQPHKAKPDFIKPSHVSKRIEIVDPAIRDRLLREKKEQEEAEREAKEKAEAERKEAERRAEEERIAAEKKAEEERIENERKAEEERKEAERKAEEERKEAERRVEEERKEAERKRLAEEASAAAAAALEKQKLEDEARRKEEEEKESRRVISELEAEKKKQDELRSHKVGRAPSPLNTAGSPVTESPLASPTDSFKAPQTQAKLIDDFSKVNYPEGITGPGITDNKKLRYSTSFMMQFRPVCLDTNYDLSVIRESLEQSTSGRATSQRQHSDRGGRAPRTPGGPNSDGMFRMGSRDGRMEMGKFNMGRPLTARNGSGQSLERQGSRGGAMMNRGGGRGGSNFGGMKIIRNPPQQHNAPNSTAPLVDDVAPLPKSENRWVPLSATKKIEAPKEGELMSQEYITRKVNALLNKLTMEKFDSIAGQIFEYAKQSAKEEDGRSLRTVIKLTFEKACDEPAFANMWAKLCKYMLDNMTDDIKDTSILDSEGKPTSGVLVFRKYLFNRCQSEFEKGWKTNMPPADENTLLTDEYYAAVKAKRQGLGLIQFIGELFKLDMLSERIMYNCMIKLCNDPQNAGDEEAESLCKLLTTIGQVLDKKPKTSKWVDIVMARMKHEMSNSPNLTSRVKFMIQDVLDLRRDKWVPRIANKQIGPTTIAKIHEQAEKDKEVKEAAAASKRNTSSRGQFIPNANHYNSHNNHPASRTGSFRTAFSSSSTSNSNLVHSPNNGTVNGGNSSHTDGWSTVSQAASKNKPSDLSNFGKMDRSRPRTNILGPSNSPFPSLSRGKSGTSLDTKGSTESGRGSPATNMFSALSAAGDKVNTDDRKPLHLLPRTTDSHTIETPSSSLSPQPASDKPQLSDDAAKRKCKNILEEYFSINDKQELSECVKELDHPHYLVLFVGQMLTVVEKKAQDVEKMCDTICYLRSQKLLSKEHFVAAFTSFMEGYDDLTIDVPQAPKFVAQLLKACDITPEEANGGDHASLKNAYNAL